MIVFQCLMVVMESGWQMVRMASPILVALFRAARFSSSFFMNSLNSSKKTKSSWMYLLKNGIHEVCSNMLAIFISKSRKLTILHFFWLRTGTTSHSRHVLILLQTAKSCEPAGCVYLIRTFTANICAFHLVLLNKSLHSLFIVRQAAVETQTLLCLRQPLQQDVNCGVKLLSLIPGETD